MVISDEPGLPPMTTERALLIGCSTVFSLGILIGWLAPQIMFGAMRHYGVLSAPAGLLTLGEGVTVGLVTLALGARPPNLRHRTLAFLGFALFIAANAVSFWAPTFSFLVVLRCMAGVSDAILAFVGVSIVAMRSRNPDSAYSILTIVGVVMGAAVVAAPPLFMPQMQGLSYLPFMAVVGLALSPLGFFIPGDAWAARSSADIASATPNAMARDSKLRFRMLVVFMVPACFQSFMLFAFSPALGARVGMSETAMNDVLSAATLASIAGPILVSPCVKYFGHFKSMLVVSVIMLGVDLVMATTANTHVFIAVLVLNSITLYFITPLLLGWAAELDHTGRCSTIMMGSLTMVTALSPTFAGSFVDHWGLASLAVIIVGTGGTYLITLGLIPVVARSRLAPAQA